jgi:ammonia channel protein AmtB
MTIRATCSAGVAPVGQPGVMTFLILKLVGAMLPPRVRQEDEITGLDVSQHGEALQ